MLLPPTDENVLSFCLRSNDENSLGNIVMDVSKRIDKIKILETGTEREFLMSVLEGDLNSQNLLDISIDEIGKISGVPEDYHKLIKESKTFRYPMVIMIFLVWGFSLLEGFVLLSLPSSSLKPIYAIIIATIIVVCIVIYVVSYRKRYKILRKAQKLLKVKVNGRSLVKKEMKYLNFHLTFHDLYSIDTAGVGRDEKVSCYACHGTGFEIKTCGKCAGSGYVLENDNEGGYRKRACPSCGGTGIFSTTCPTCSGHAKFGKYKNIVLYNSLVEKLNKDIQHLNSKDELLKRARESIDKFNEKVSLWNSKIMTKNN